jgi:hypothetical protein
MDVEGLRLNIYRSFAETGAPPKHDDIASQLGATTDEIVAGIRLLADNRHLVIDSDATILMAHPFSSIPLGFSVMGEETLWWGGCCWDSFAIPHLVTNDSEVLVATQCPGCGRPGAWVVDRAAPPESDWLAHFLVPASRMWDDVVYTCSNQRLFCSQDCIDDWLVSNGRSRGYVMDVETLWTLASGWYAGRLDVGYQRREPSESAAFLREVGLIDPFWGTA